MTVLTREGLNELRELDDSQRELVEVPEWPLGDGHLSVWIHGLSGIDRDDFDLAMLDQKKDKRGRVVSQEINLRNLRAKLIIRTAHESEDPASPLLFQPSDVFWLGKKSGSALQRLYAVAMRLSGLTEEDVEEMTTELGKGQSDSSGSDLPSSLDTPQLEGSSETSAVKSSPNGSRLTDESPSEVEDSTYSSPV